MLRRLKINRFRHVAPGTELEFSGRYNVLLGKNGTGKTTLLDLISMVLRSDFSSLREEEFDIEYEFEFDTQILRVRFKNQLPHEGRLNVLGHARRASHPHVYIVTSQLNGSTFEVEIDGASMRWRFANETWQKPTLVDVFERGLRDAEDLARFPPFHMLWLHVKNPEAEPPYLHGTESTRSQIYRFDESLSIFNNITGVISIRPGQDANEPHIRVLYGFSNQPAHREVHAVFFPYDKHLGAPEVGHSSTIVEIPNDTALAQFIRLACFESMSMSLAIEGSSVKDDITVWRFDHAEFFFTTSNEETINHHALSYGQKRLLAFLYYLDVNQQYVIADELVNGMHHDWIKACLELMGTRQAFLTSQNPLLLDYLPLESVEQVQRSFIQCKVNTSDKKSEFVWSNLDAEDARQLLADYEVGIQHVGELLRVRGLW